MQPIRPLPFREVARKLHAAGFTELSQRGSHVKFRRLNGRGGITVVVLRHNAIAIGTLRDIIKQAGLTRREFWEL